MGNSSGSHANNSLSPGSDRLTTVQSYMSASCQISSRVIRAFSDVKKALLLSEIKKGVVGWCDGAG